MSVSIQRQQVVKSTDLCNVVVAYLYLPGAFSFQETICIATFHIEYLISYISYSNLITPAVASNLQETGFAMK